MKAKAVPANEPVKLINRPNLGTKIAPIETNITVNVLQKSILISANYCLKGFGNRAYKSEVSYISKTGIICIGKVPRSPAQYIIWTKAVRLSWGKFNVTISSNSLP